MTGSVSLLTTLLVAVIALCFSSQSVQGENVDAGKLSLFMALHSHQDLAWLQTAESYFEGNAYGCTSCFYSDMTAFLTQHPQYKMLVVEVWFLKRWWEWSPGEERAAFRNLLENGQIEIVNGGMSTNDEACIYHDHLIDQFTLGHQFLLKTFNITPHIGWSVDPFGHSAGHAWLLSKMGYDSLFLGRIHDKDKEARKINGQMEFIWHPFNDQKQQLFTHILFNNYFEAPIWNNQQFCKYLLCNEQITNETMSAFLDFLTERKKASLTDNVFYAIGDDFAFSFSGEKDLNNVTIFMEKIKPSLKEFKFSGLGDYLKRVHESFIGNKNKGSKGQDLSTFTEDFFPHTSFEIMSGRLMPWTGFYTTKPVLKGLAYEAMRYLTSLRTLYAKILLSDSQASLLHRRNVWDQLYPLEEALAIISHHDGITGTSRAVVDDEDFYGRTIKAKKKVEETFLALLEKYLAQERLKEPTVTLETSGWKNEYFDFSYTQSHSAMLIQSNYTHVTVFNPANTRINLYIKLKTKKKGLAVFDHHNQPVRSDIFCLNTTNPLDCTLYFTKTFNPFEVKTFRIIPTKVSDVRKPQNAVQPIEVANGRLKLKFLDENMTTFSLSTCNEASECVNDVIQLDYKYYTSRFSGAYLFDPKSQEPSAFGNFIKSQVFLGDFLTIIQIIRDTLVTTITIYNEDVDSGIEIQTYIHPIVEILHGVEVVMSINSSTINNGAGEKNPNSTVFYTDSNGLRMMKRIFGFKDTFTPATRTIQENYYPITSAIYIEDNLSQKRLTLLTDRSQGGTSPKIGNIEVMLHRICELDDELGLQEVLKDLNPKTRQTRIVDVSHYLILGKGSEAQRKRQYRIDNQPLVFLGSSKAEFNPIREEKRKPLVEGPSVEDNNMKVSMRFLPEGDLLVRLLNLDENKNQVVSVNKLMEKLVGHLMVIKEMKEVTLSGNQNLNESVEKKLEWIKTKDSQNKIGIPIISFWLLILVLVYSLDKLEIAPMDLRAFVIKL